MSTYDPVAALLEKALAEYKETVDIAYTIAKQNEVLDSFNLNRLIKANARAEAALKVKLLIEKATEEDLPRIVQQLKANAKTSLQGGHAHFSVVSFYNETLKALNSNVRVI